MIGYYVHHHGSGHLHRARSLVRHLEVPVTGLSTLAHPADWPGEWVQLDRDDTGPRPVDPGAGGRLHWAPLGDPGLRRRTAAVSAWIERARPEAMVVDVSVEVALLARLHGVPVVTVVLPGHRGDAAHRLGYEASTALVGAWPASAHARMVTGLDPGAMARIEPVGAISRFDPSSGPDVPVVPRTVVVLLGTGGDDVAASWLTGVAAAVPDWSWTVLGGAGGTWVEDPWPVLRSAEVVLTHGGQNAVAEVAAARRPAIVLPQTRPHEEQVTTAAVLDAGPWPAVTVRAGEAPDWRDLLEHVAGLDGAGWGDWCDGDGGLRAAGVVDRARLSSQLLGADRG